MQSNEMTRSPRKEQPSIDTHNTILLMILIVLVAMIGAAAWYIYY
jgi:uncharacterized protein HemX